METDGSYESLESLGSGGKAVGVGGVTQGDIRLKRDLDCNP